MLWAAVGLMAVALVGDHPAPPSVSVYVVALIGASVVGGLLVSRDVRPQPGIRDLGLGIISLGSIDSAARSVWPWSPT